MESQLDLKRHEERFMDWVKVDEGADWGILLMSKNSVGGGRVS